MSDSNFGIFSGMNIDNNLIGDLSSDENNNKEEKQMINQNTKIYVQSKKNQKSKNIDITRNKNV